MLTLYLLSKSLKPVIIVLLLILLFIYLEAIVVNAKNCTISLAANFRMNNESYCSTLDILTWFIFMLIISQKGYFLCSPPLWCFLSEGVGNIGNNCSAREALAIFTQLLYEKLLGIGWKKNYGNGDVFKIHLYWWF